MSSTAAPSSLVTLGLCQVYSNEPAHHLPGFSDLNDYFHFSSQFTFPMFLVTYFGQMSEAEEQNWNGLFFAIL